MSFPRDAYPYTNFHELNLGYFIVHFREIFSQWADLYDQMLNWKNATTDELAAWKTGVEADLDQREAALRAELETWKAQTGQDIAGWEDATLAALTAWQTATQAVFEAIRVEAAGSASAAAASAGDATTAKTAAETAQAAAEAAAASVQASAAQITTNTEDIADLKTQLNDLADDQIITLFNESVSGTRLVTIPKVIPAGTYHLKIDSVTSDDTAHSTSRITFWNGSTTLTYKDVNRQNGYDGTITLNSDTTSIAFYGYYNYDNSAGIHFVFEDVLLSKNTNLNNRLTSIENSLLTIDTTLQNSGEAADAKVTGEKINHNAADIDLLAEKQLKGIYYGSPSGTQVKSVPLSLPAGNYHLKIDSVTSDDTQYNTSRIIFFNGSSVVSAYDISRQNGTDRDITLSSSTTSIAFYGAHNNTDSAGISFTYNNVVLSRSTGLDKRFLKTEQDVDDIYDTQLRRFFGDTVSGTAYKKISVNLPAGTYTMHADNVVSSDTDSAWCLYAFSGGGTVLFSDGMTRGQNKSATVTLASPADALELYASNNWGNSQGDTFEYTNLTITQDTELNRRITNKVDKNTVNESLVENFINPYHDVLFAEDEVVKTTTHAHCTTQGVLDKLLAKNLDAIALSNYYPSHPYYPASEHNLTVPDGIIEIPNAEQHGFTNTIGACHLNSVGSTFASGKAQGQTPVGVNDTWQNAIIKIKRDLLLADGGGVTINHPTWSQLTYKNVIDILDFDNIVLGIEIYSGNGAETRLQDNLELWDDILISGRRCWAFAVPDHYAERDDGENWKGTITIFVPSKTQADALRAIRNGAFYCQINHTTLGLDSIAVNDRNVTITVNESATIRTVIDGATVDTTTGTTKTVTVPEDAVYVRFEVETANDAIYTNPIMFRTRRSIITK